MIEVIAMNYGSGISHCILLTGTSQCLFSELQSFIFSIFCIIFIEHCCDTVGD